MGQPVLLHRVRARDRRLQGDVARTSDALHDIAGVSTVSFTRQTISTYRHTLSVVDMVVVVLIVSAGALAFIVLYNLTNINVSERVREIASLHVLGFTRRGVHAYVYREMPSSRFWATRWACSWARGSSASSSTTAESTTSCSGEKYTP